MRGMPGVCSVIGCASLVGTLVEPVTWHRRAWSVSIATTVAANLAASVALAVSGGQMRRESGALPARGAAVVSVQRNPGGGTA